MVDRHALFAECLGLVLELRSYRYKVVAIPPGASQSERVLNRLLAARPDVVLLNADLGPECNAVTIIEPLVRAGVAVVVLTDTADEGQWGQCLAQGARVVLPKSEPVTVMVSAISRASHGEAVLQHTERDRLIGLYSKQDGRMRRCRERLDRLSTSEGEILRHLMAGRSVCEIAAQRFVSEATVRTQVKAILFKLELKSQLAAVAAARDGGWDPEALPIAV
jgi:DNA-binding NarL/FixJ family response regulator